MAVVVYKLNTILLLVFTVMVSQALGQEVCFAPLGMSNGNIKDSQITVSSNSGLGGGGKFARLHKNIRSWGAWCPKLLKSSVNVIYDDYIQIDLLNLTKIRKVAIQGRELNNGNEFTKTYQISYSNDNRRWIYYQENSKIKVFTGNTNVKSVVPSNINLPIVARYVRIHPGISDREVCLRLELYGCPVKDGIVSYSMPQGQTIKNGKIKYEDTIYDGIIRNGILYNGTGFLTDGKIGPVNSKENMGKEWVGWRKSSTGQDGVNITFKFSTLRRFDNVIVTMNLNQLRRNMLFSKSQILFGVREDVLSQSSALQYCPEPVQLNTANINVTLSLCGNVGKFVRIQLYPAGRWMLISEIKFNSVPVSEEKEFRHCSDGRHRLCGIQPSAIPTTTCTGIRSYSMPQGEKIFNGTVHYIDTIYNGTTRKGILYNGTGLLTDGKIGPVVSTEDRGNEWVGWSNTSTSQDGVNITFEFCTLRKFIHVSVITNINNKHGNMLFHKSRVFFSQVANGFSDSSTLEYLPKQVQMKTLIGNMNVTIPLCGNVAKFVRIQLYLDGGSILLSEITFNSVTALPVDQVLFKTCSDTHDSKICELTESSSAHLLYILIALVCVLCFIGLVVLALLLKRRKIKQPARSQEMTLCVPSNNENVAVPEAASSSNQIRAKNEQNQLEEEQNQEDEGYEYPERSEHQDPSYTSLMLSSTEDENTYQKLQKSSA